MPTQRQFVNQLVQLNMLRYMRRMADELKDQRVPVMMSFSDLVALDAWRRQQEDLPSRGEAIRRLIGLGLKAAGHKEVVSKPEG
jgi:hypothetical protein